TDQAQPSRPTCQRIGPGFVRLARVGAYCRYFGRNLSNYSYLMSRQTSTMTISLPEDLKQFVKKRSLTAHYGTPSDYIRGLIREDLKRLETERLEIELMQGLKGTGIPMTPEAWKRMRTEAAQIITSKRSLSASAVLCRTQVVARTSV